MGLIKAMGGGIVVIGIYSGLYDLLQSTQPNDRESVIEGLMRRVSVKRYRQFGNVPLTTWCTPDAHPNAHLVNSDHMVLTQIMNTWCTPGAHLVHAW